ncbi:MAG: hypothetical protein Q8P67_08875 [archaeon]|nr:hypothetical protein [archaeon]
MYPDVDIDEEEEVRKIKEMQELRFFEPLLPEVYEHIRVWLQSVPPSERPPTRRALEKQLRSNSTPLLRSSRKFKVLKLLEPLLSGKLLTVGSDGDSLAWDG